MIVALQTLVFFRESLLSALDRLLRPYYTHLTLAFTRSGNVLEDEDSDDQVFGEYDDEKGVVFYPPVYAQRYAAVSDWLMDERWCGKIEKVVDFGHHDMSFIKYLKDVPGIRCILGVDIETIPLRCFSDVLGGDEYSPKRESPLQVTLYQGNAADPDYRLIGCDAVIAIEMIEHMLPHDLERLVHTVFGFIKPWIAIFTTPNADFNVLFKALEKNGLRRMDHFFEWTREQFNDWCSNIVVRYPNYTVTCQGIGPGPPGTRHLGCCSQLCLFISKNYQKQDDLHINSLALVAKAPNPNNFSDVIGGWASSVSTRQELECVTAGKQPESQPEDGSHTWNNINWGDNAPYWNQYYKIVREYIYPFETKSEECRMLDLISEEINRLIDTQYDEEYSVDVNRLEIPLSHLMTVVQHITTDVDRVRDLLEWNGYEIVNDVVIHSRLVVDNTSVVTRTHDEDWQDDALSDWDTEIHSTSLSDGSTIVPDLPGRCLRRALDQKVRSLRTMLIADEDITTELDRVVCRLMKLALQSSRARQTPPPSRWMQCKLLDLLTLTEKAIGRRRQQFFTNYPLLAIEESKQPDLEIDQDIRIKGIVDKYRHLIQPIGDIDMNFDDMKITDIETDCQNADLDIMGDEFLSTTSNEFLKGISPSLVIPHPVFSTENIETVESPSVEENPFDRTKAWLDDDIEVATYAKQEINYENVSSGDTDHSLTNGRQKHKKSGKKHKIANKDSKEFKTDLKLSSPSKVSSKIKIKRDDKHKKKNGNTSVTKKVPKKKPCYNTLVKNSSIDYDSYPIKSKRKSKENLSFNVSAIKTSKPIPESLIELCHPELKAEKVGQPRITTDNIPEISNNVVIANMPGCDISATEEGYLVDIVMQDFQETISLRRTIGTDAEEMLTETNNEVGDLNNVFDEVLCANLDMNTENAQTQPIFLNDINEPSTSKGIRHNISTDVQCGPDTFATYPMLSASTSLVKMPPIFTAGVKIQEVGAEVNGVDFGTSTQDTDTTTITPRLRSVGIKIKDSDVHLNNKTESCTMTVQDSMLQTTGIVSNITPPRRSSGRNSIISSPETKMLKAISSNLKTEDSGSEFCPSIASSSKTHTFFVNASINASQVLVRAPISKDVIIEATSSKNLRPRLCCGGVHVHSFKEKESCEDVVYQGQWQRHKSKACARKRTYNFTSLRKVNEAAAKKNREALKEKVQRASSKEKVCRRRPDKKEVEAVIKKPIQVRNATLHKLKQDQNSQTNKSSVASTSKILNTAKKISRPVKAVTKVASKIGISVVSKNPKSTFTVKKPAILPNLAAKKDNDIPQKLKKSYLPIYLRKASQLSDSDKENLNKSVSFAHEANQKKENQKMVNKVPFKTPVTKDLNNDLLRFGDEVRENISYLVFRNEVQNDVESSEELSSGSAVDHNKGTSKTLEALKRSHSPQSMNSSTCSSLNSVATVRAATTRNKSMSHKRHAASSYKSNLTNSESDSTTPTKIKKVIKRVKSAKKNETKDVTNKENVPESSQNFANKEKDKIPKVGFNSRHKSVFIAQIKPEGSPPSNTLSRHKTQTANKSNVKIVTRQDSDEKRRANGSTVSKKKSIKSDTSSAYEDFNMSQSDSYESSDSTNMVLVLEPQLNYDNIMDMQNISPVRTTECDIGPTSNFVPEWGPNSSSHSRNECDTNSTSNLVPEWVQNSSLHSYTKCDTDPSNNLVPGWIQNLSLHSPSECDKAPTTNLRPEWVQKSRLHSDGKCDTNATSNLVPEWAQNLISQSRSECDVDPTTHLVPEWVRNSSLHSNGSNILIFVRRILEDTLDLIPTLNDQNMHDLDSKTVILSREQNYKPREIKDDPSDVKATTESDEIKQFLVHDIDAALNKTSIEIDTVLADDSTVSLNDTRLTIADLDMLSCDSIPSVSKYSEYFSADNEVDVPEIDQAPTTLPQNTSSVRGIFERKEPHLIQNTPGALAVQAFSGFSLDVEPLVGDQPDPVSLIDSETGSPALEYTRQATSEELFISGRSSDSYESCLIDDDTVVPHWLFQLISQQQSVEDDREPVLLGPVAAPPNEPMYDANGNVIEPSMVGVGAGAGDGHGMHSDHSQDSSGRGTSLSSSSSSGPQSEVSTILIDPFSTPFDLLRDPMSSSAVMSTEPHHSSDRTYRIDSDSRVDRTRTINGASDVDADVSSLDTDVPDLSDN